MSLLFWSNKTVWDFKMRITFFKNLIAIFRKINTERRQHWDKAFFFKYSFDRLSKKNRILDIGCGNGFFLGIADNNNTIGIDANYINLSQARNYSNKVIQGNILNLPFFDASFDGINCSHVIEHFGPDDAYKLLSEMNRVLKIGGTIILSTPILWDGFFKDFTHVKPYNPEAIMHYYGNPVNQTTKEYLDCLYKINEMKWRYKKVALKTIRLPKGSILNTFLFLLTECLNKLNFGKYERIGYTMVLEKLR